ncbi:MAG TPA: UvrD-helicase domain-containing protein, partial [Myxococcales bacterium]
MSDLRPLFALSESAVVQAGAGTGKTHSLVTLCLHLLGGAGRAEPLPAARLWAVTFTEKAAAELKGRIRERVDALAECPPEEVARIEPELAASGAPPPELWRRVRRDLGAAQVGTIHGLCSQILRRHA